MTISLFDGSMHPDLRCRAVATMMGYARDDLDYPREFVERTLAKAERIAYQFLREEIAEAKRGEAAARYVKAR